MTSFLKTEQAVGIRICKGASFLWKGALICISPCKTSSSPARVSQGVGGRLVAPSQLSFLPPPPVLPPAPPPYPHPGLLPAVLKVMGWYVSPALFICKGGW